MLEQIKKQFPEPISVKKLIGPSFVILALGLGSGEVILWPYLASNYGLGIVWGALLGITCQFFINMEIERYALAKGESVFVGLAKLFRFAPQWFVVSTFIGFGLPGIIAASAEVFVTFSGIGTTKWVGIVFLLIIGIILSTGKTVYGMMEHLTKIIIFIGVPFIFLLALYLSSGADWSALAAGVIGNGDGYRFLPPGIVLATFFGAFAYSGAAGNLNLTQSIYIKEKGYGMGAYAQKITGFFAKNTKIPQDIKLDGNDFELTEDNLSRFRAWWKVVNIEHAIVFWGVGSISMLMLMLLAYSTTYGSAGTEEGILFIIKQASVISELIIPAVGAAFLFVVTVMLFQTQLGVMDSTSRIMAENVAIQKIKKTKNPKVPLSKIYASFVWAQVIFGIALFLLDLYEPRSLIVMGAVINAFAMFVHIGMVSWLNFRLLPKPLQPKLWRRIILVCIFLFFGCFSFFILYEKIGGLFI